MSLVKYTVAEWDNFRLLIPLCLRSGTTQFRGVLVRLQKLRTMETRRLIRLRESSIFSLAWACGGVEARQYPWALVFVGLRESGLGNVQREVKLNAQGPR